MLMNAGNANTAWAYTTDCQCVHPPYDTIFGNVVSQSLPPTRQSKRIPYRKKEVERKKKHFFVRTMTDDIDLQASCRRV
jgi:hypothetical protein